MKTAVIYTSQTGFTKRYAEWITEKTNADIFDLKDAQKKDVSFFDSYDALIYAGGAIAGLGGLYFVMEYLGGTWTNNGFGDRGWLAGSSAPSPRRSACCRRGRSRGRRRTR